MGASKSYALSEQLGAADFRIRPLADRFLYRELVRVNARTSVPNFKFLATLGYRDMEVSQNTKWALLISPDAP